MTLLATALVVAAGAVFAHTAIQNSTERLRSDAISGLKEAIATQAFGGSLPPDATTNAAVVPDELRTSLRGTDSIVTFAHGGWMWAARNQTSGIIASRVSVAPVPTEWRQLQQTFAAAAVLAAAVAAIGSWILASRLTARLRRAASAVDDTVRGRPTTPVRGHDEVAVLARSLEATAAALTRSLDHERAISAEVAHDLRTPVTALIGAVELLPEGPDTARVRRVADRVHRLLEDLLELSRAAHTSSSAQLRPVDLAELVTRLVAERAADSPDQQPTVVIRSTATVKLDEGHFARALANLIGNAYRHGAAPVEVVVDGAEVVVRDHGTGFPEELLRDGPRRFGALGSNGSTGIGLAIALQHLAATDGTLTLSNPADGGAAATMGFTSS